MSYHIYFLYILSLKFDDLDSEKKILLNSDNNDFARILCWHFLCYVSNCKIHIGMK